MVDQRSVPAAATQPATASSRRALAAPVERGARRLYYLDRDRAPSNKKFFLDGALFWPITPTLRQHPAMFHVEPMEDGVVWALPLPTDQEVPRTCAGWTPWIALDHRAQCTLLDGKM